MDGARLGENWAWGLGEKRMVELRIKGQEVTRRHQRCGQAGEGGYRVWEGESSCA